MEPMKSEKVPNSENSVIVTNVTSDKLAQAKKEDLGETTKNIMGESKKKNLSPPSKWLTYLNLLYTLTWIRLWKKSWLTMDKKLNIT